MEKRRAAHVAIAGALVAALYALIFALSDQPAAESSELSWGLVNGLLGTETPGSSALGLDMVASWQFTLEAVVRKLAHLVEYAMLGAAVANLLLRVADLRASGRPGGRKMARTARLGVYAMLLCAVYAASDELHQLFVPGRAGMFGDVLLDVCGAAIGVALLLLAWRARTGAGE